MNFRKLKMHTKIRAGMLLVFLISVVIGVYGALAIGRITSYIAQLEELTAANNQASEILQAQHVWISGITESFMFDTPFTDNLDPEAGVWGEWRYSERIHDIDDAMIMELILAVDGPHTQMLYHGSEALRLRAAGSRGGSLNTLRNYVLPYGAAATEAIEALADRYMELWEEVRESLRQVGPEVMRTIIIVYILALAAFAALSIIIPRSILKPVKRADAMLADVTEGRFEFNRAADNLANDEIGRLTKNVFTLTDTVKGITDDLNNFVHAYADDGDVDFRIDDSKYKGSYAELVRGINRFGDSSGHDVDILLGVLENINNGEFDIQIERLPGKKVLVNEAVDVFVKNLEGVFAQLRLAVDGTKTGVTPEFSPDEFKGGWRTVVLGLIDIFKAMDAPILEVMAVMERLSNGYFDKKVTGDYLGDFLELKNSVNTTIDVLNSYIAEMSESLQTVASGDLTKSITREYIGDFIAIKDSINNISTTLNKTMTEISAASEQVLSGARQISESAANLASGATEQASSVQELNASVDLISQQTKKNAENADEANTLSGRSTENAKEGNTAVAQMLEAMNGIKESSGNISKIISTIQEIAFQTNLLALNASIEAAHAGDQGKGFAVVADEVRNLAAKSQLAASETTGLIEDSINRVDAGSGIAETTAKALDIIVENAEGVLNIISYISASSKEQAESIEQISTGLGQISTVVQSNSAASEETAAAAEELNSQAELLRQHVGYFKLEK